MVVFVHGESFDWGTGNAYDGSILAGLGRIIIVTLNYRWVDLRTNQTKITKHTNRSNLQAGRVRIYAESDRRVGPDESRDSGRGRIAALDSGQHRTVRRQHVEHHADRTGAWRGPGAVSHEISAEQR